MVLVMAGQVCPKCGQVIKSGEKIIYEEGKPIHYPSCPESRDYRIGGKGMSLQESPGILTVKDYLDFAIRTIEIANVAIDWKNFDSARRTIEESINSLQKAKKLIPRG
jgi:hypothetical protein